MLSGLRKFSLKTLLRYVWAGGGSVAVGEDVVLDADSLGEPTGWAGRIQPGTGR